MRSISLDPEPRWECSTGNEYGWGMSLLQLLLQKRPHGYTKLLEIAAEAGSWASVQFLLGPRRGIDAPRVSVIPAMIAAARGGHKLVIQKLMDMKPEDEHLDMSQLSRQLTGFDDDAALRMLEDVLAQVNPSLALNPLLGVELETARTLFKVCGVKARTEAAAGSRKRGTRPSRTR